MADDNRPRWYTLTCKVCKRTMNWQGRPDAPRPLHMCCGRAEVFHREEEIRRPAPVKRDPLAPVKHRNRNKAHPVPVGPEEDPWPPPGVTFSGAVIRGTPADQPIDLQA